MMYEFLASIRILVQLKILYNRGELKLLQWREWVVKLLRGSGWLKQNQSMAYKFAIMCVKRPIYVELAIENINSLHLHNPTHHVTIYADQICAKHFGKLRSRVHYPAQVSVIIFIKKPQPWQISKVETLMDASKRGMVLLDADGIWHSDPTISANKVTFLVPTYRFKTHKQEKALILSLFKKPQWLDHAHYVTGFVSIPPKYLTSPLRHDCLAMTRTILRCQDPYIKRLAEEIGISLAVQRHVPAKSITTLKQSDGPGDHQILQSMYYGCMNEILE